MRRISLGATTFLLDDPDGQTFAGQFVEGGNYVVFHNVTGDSFKLRIANASPYEGYTRPTLAGLQIVGGAAKDSVVIGGDFEKDVVVGDSGQARFFQGAIYQFETTELAAGNAFDADTISTGDGRDIVLGGNGPDMINAGVGDDIVLGDNARIALFQGHVIGLQHDSGRLAAHRPPP